MAKKSLPNNFSIDNLEFVPLSRQPTFQNLIGLVFTRLTVLGYAGKQGWFCRCECGNILKVFRKDLYRARTKSCGCLKVDNTRLRCTTHGRSKSSIYTVWSHIIRRCCNSKAVEYQHYGGRGIKMCDRWRHSFENFLADMGERPSKKHSINRINNDGDYEPGNCAWALPVEQANNMRTNRRLTLNGKTQTVTQWAEELGIHRDAIYGRLRRGLSDVEALSQTNYLSGHPSLRGSDSPSAKLSEADVLQIRSLRGQQTQRLIALRFGINQSTVSEIQLRKKWAHL